MKLALQYSTWVFRDCLNNLVLSIRLLFCTPHSLLKSGQHLLIHRILIPGVICLITSHEIYATSPPDTESIKSVAELKKMSLEELFNIEVISVSKKPEQLSAIPASVFVVTAEDIRRSGARSIPEALRNIPGIEVARVDARQYAITAHGFNGTTSNKLLILMDGRSLYTPLFSGVFWDAQNTPMENIERIEVIRGPGATVWGANAVNGVINIITKNAADTQGYLLTSGVGNEEQGFGSLQWGGQIKENMSLRLYGQRFNRDDSVFANGRQGMDQYHMEQGGFRLDWKASNDDAITFQGDIYGSSADQRAADDITFSGGNLITKWTHTYSQDSDLQIVTYYDRTERDIPSLFGETLNTYDVDLRHRFGLGSRHDFIWGLGYRYLDNTVVNSPSLAFYPARLSQDVVTAFIEDQITLVENKLKLTLGSKFEYNYYSDFEYQPSIRLAWTPAPEHFIWGVVSRAVRTPSRIDQDFFIPGNPPFSFIGNSEYDSEKLYAYELGYKTRMHPKVTASLSTFYNTYDELRSAETWTPTFLDNRLKGESYGIDIHAMYQALDWWRLISSYSFFALQLHTENGSRDITSENVEGDSPQNQYSLTSRMDLPYHLEFDSTIRYVDSLPNQNVPPYTAFDVRIGYKYSKNLEISLVGMNLLDPQHPEFGAPNNRREVQRSIYGKLTLKF